MSARPKFLPCIAAAVLANVGVSATVLAGQPTCSELGIVVHAQHIIGDYVTGIGGLSGALGWPPKKGVVGQTVSANGGPVVVGGPGPGFHFPMSVPPGASFCVNSQSINAVNNNNASPDLP